MAVFDSEKRLYVATSTNNERGCIPPCNIVDTMYQLHRKNGGPYRVLVGRTCEQHVRAYVDLWSDAAQQSWPLGFCFESVSFCLKSCLQMYIRRASQPPNWALKQKLFTSLQIVGGHLPMEVVPPRKGLFLIRGPLQLIAGCHLG